MGQSVPARNDAAIAECAVEGMAVILWRIGVRVA